MKDEFVSAVSHELRTPLTAIAGSLGLLAAGAAGALTERTRHLLDIARKNSDRLTRLINDLLDIGKMEAGKLPLALRPVPLAEALRQAAEQNRPYAERLGVGISLDLPGEELVACADPDRL
jgi:signal transduction histidine kinase